MFNTEMLYMQDNYIQNFEAKVISNGKNYLVLNKTAFYPEGGGQESDIGNIMYANKTLTVTIVKKESGEVRHYIAENELLPPIDTMIKGQLNWERRFTHMRFHSAIHILSTYMKKEFNADVVGNNISTRNGRIDFSSEKTLTEEQLKKIEKDLNEIIAKNLPVKISFMPREKAKEFLKEKGYQIEYIEMVPSSVKIFRIISIGDYDHASCAGTHVNNTSVIGKVKIVKRRSMGIGKERIILALE